MKNFWKQLDTPFFALAPLAGYTDEPFRLLCKEYGVDVLYSEMVSSEAIFHNVTNYKFCRNEKIKKMHGENLYKTLKLIGFLKIEQPFVVQIFGANPHHMAFAAEYIASGEWKNDLTQILQTMAQDKTADNKESKFYNLANAIKMVSVPAGIDINMGCPARDVIKVGAGAALMKNYGLACEIVRNVKKIIPDVPVSVKTRLGWEKNTEIIEFSKKIEEVGADALAIHGRTYKQCFSGPVDWDKIAAVKKQIQIPVIGNGGIGRTDLRLSDIAIDGFMIGTGALGQPWIFEEMKQQITQHVDRLQQKDFMFIKQNILKHAKLVQEIKGERGIIEFRKHVGWYLKGLPDVKELRHALVKTSSVSEIEKIFDDFAFKTKQDIEG